MGGWGGIDFEQLRATTRGKKEASESDRASEKEGVFFFLSFLFVLLDPLLSSSSRRAQRIARGSEGSDTSAELHSSQKPKALKSSPVPTTTTTKNSLKKKKKKKKTAWVDLNRQATKVAGNAAPGTSIEKLGENYVTKVFDQARDAGFNLVRVFGHGEETSFMLQTAPGQYDERIFRGLDYINAVAGSRGTRVLFVPINMWLSPHVGDGFGTYVEWAGYPVSQSVSFGWGWGGEKIFFCRFFFKVFSRSRAAVSSLLSFLRSL